MAAARALTPLLAPANPSPLPLGSGREGRGEEEEEEAAPAPRARARLLAQPQRRGLPSRSTRVIAPPAAGEGRWWS